MFAGRECQDGDLLLLDLGCEYYRCACAMSRGANRDSIPGARSCLSVSYALNVDLHCHVTMMVT